jgi:hypothetical protein
MAKKIKKSDSEKRLTKIEKEYRLLSAEDVSRMLDVPVNTLRYWRWKRINLSYVDFGSGKVRYCNFHIKDFILKHSIEPQK